jgi:hypothetical protein
MHAEAVDVAVREGEHAAHEREVGNVMGNRGPIERLNDCVHGAPLVQ